MEAIFGAFLELESSSEGVSGGSGLRFLKPTSGRGGEYKEVSQDLKKLKGRWIRALKRLGEPCKTSPLK